MLRRTKIVTTLGPATDDPSILKQLLQAGANVVRLNFSHGDAAEHRRRVTQVREAAAELSAYVAVLGDLQGPKIRIARFTEGEVYLQAGQSFTLDAELGTEDGDQQQVGLDYKGLPTDVKPDDILLLDDGRMKLRVTEVVGSAVHTQVLLSGRLGNNKGINLQGGGLSATALTGKDRDDIRLAAELGVDFLAVSFPRSADDMNQARSLLREAGSAAALCAKIERAEAVASEQALSSIIQASEVVMVARGDLGVEIGDAKLVGTQKRIIQRARELNRAVITATQMMESMIESSMPTRAEVMDVANAVLDGTDAVMLSAETAMGKYPVATVEAMADICVGAEEYPTQRIQRDPATEHITSVAEANAMAAMYTANHLAGVQAIVALTESGHTAKLMSRTHTALPVFALSRHLHSLNKCALYRGVYPVYFDTRRARGMLVFREALEMVAKRSYVTKGDLVILTHGDVMEEVGSSNTTKILSV